MDKLTKEATDCLKQNGFSNPTIGIILGTGLGKIVDLIKIESELSYDKIPGFPISTVESHAGKLIYGALSNKRVVVMQGRFHYYEGYSIQQISFPVRVMKSLGIKALIITNAAGAVNLSFKKGSLMIIKDHINLLNNNPLIGVNNKSYECRLPQTVTPYCLNLIKKTKSVSKSLGIDIKEGVYAAMQGPMLETAAEYRMLNLLGADAVGMSTIPEVIVANQIGLNTVAISVLTDECDPDNLKPVELSEIIAVANNAEKDLIRLVSELVIKI